MKADFQINGEKTDDPADPAGRPLVSVCMPAHNSRATIREAIGSALLQNVSLEVVVVDDASTDDTAEIVRELKRRDHRVRLICCRQNIGAARSRNLAVAMARGEYAAFLDSDDRWLPGKLAAQLELMRQSDCSLCCTGRELLTSAGERTGRVIGVKSRITYRDLLKHNSINCSSVLIRRETAQRYPMEHEDSHEDYITWLRILRDVGPAAGIREPYLLYRLSGSGKSGMKWKSAWMTWRAYRYAGLGRFRSAVCFISYAFHGVWKYLTA